MAMFGFVDTVFPILFTTVFVLVFGMIVFTVIRSIGQWHKNNNSPRLIIEAEVVGRRTIRRQGDEMRMSRTDYYATFEVKGGDRLEFCVDGSEYGQLAKGDRGELTFQGTRYIGFARTMSDVS